jgi:hypothetical protein
MPSLDPDVADLVPSDPALTGNDEQHAITYMRLLDADAEGADWREVARIVPHIDPDREPDRARQAFESHLARANGWQGTATGTCFNAAGLAERTDSAYRKQLANRKA